MECLLFSLICLIVGDNMDFTKFLKSKKLKVTKGRLAILDILFMNINGITAEFILDKCKENGVDINLSTVYRGVELFEEKGIIEKYPLKDGTFAYGIKGEEHKHILQCSVCHKEVEVPCPMKQIEVQVQKETGFTLTEHNLCMTGVCEECRRK